MMEKKAYSGLKVGLLALFFAFRSVGMLHLCWKIEYTWMKASNTYTYKGIVILSYCLGGYLLCNSIGGRIGDI